MELIVGLGNPGRAYESSRHNLGFAVVKLLAANHGISLKRDNLNLASVGKGNIAGVAVALALPRTFMNLSGSSVRLLAEKYRAAPAGTLIVYDDLDLEYGRMRLGVARSSGGHKGVESIIGSWETRDFWRLRIGIGRPPQGMDAATYVLRPFSKKEKKAVGEIIEGAAAIIESWLKEKTPTTVNIFNTRSS